jgi:NitT/TauT family transport system substrate-binding protein
VSQGTSQGAREALHPYEQTAPDYTVATYLTTKQRSAQNEDVIDRFVRAINKSLAYAESHPAVVRQVGPTYTKIPTEVAAKMHLPQAGADLNRQTIQQTVDLAQKYRYIKDEPDLGELIRPADGQ